MPTGNITGEIIVRASVSESNKNKPPNIADAGIRKSSSPPIILRTIWGTTKPTKAIIP